MMGFLADYHVHMEKGPLTADRRDAFIEAARRQGLAEMGFSEHICDFYEGQAACGHWWEVEGDPEDREHAERWWRGRPRASMAEYVALIRSVQHTDIAVRMGLEADFLPGQEESQRHFLASFPLDYVLGSVHWLGVWGFDHLDRLERWRGRDVDQAFRQYFDLLCRAARSGLYDIIAHADVIKLAGYRPSYDLTPLHEEAARAFAEGGVAVEVSTAGLRRPCHEIYPAESFLRLCRAAGVPIIISSDAHRPEDVGRDFPAAVGLARRCGYTHTCRFVRRQREEVPLE